MMNEANMESGPAVLLVDDDHELCAMLVEYLSREGYRVHAVNDGASGVTAVAQGGFDIVVMDISMPRMDGFDALRRMRVNSSIPVLMLTARGDDVDRIVGLELGADDYLGKPFNPRELSARLKAILRRATGPETGPGAAKPHAVVVGDLMLDAGRRVVLRSGEPLALTGTEYAVAEILMRSSGQVISKDTLSQQVLGRRLLPFDRSIDTHVSNLRRKLGPTANDEPRIRTVRGRGYVLVTP
jgi:two-component system response regulator CpxR